MDSLERALTAPPPKDPRNHCGVQEWLNTQTPERVTLINKALADPQWSSAALYRVIAGEGFPLNADRLRIHRRGECACGRS